MKHELPELPYALDALEPHISNETMEFHYGKHHKTYVDNLNELIKGTPQEQLDLVEIIRTAQGPVFNNAAQTWNHTFFWHSLSPEGGGNPEGRLAQAIDSAFGSFDLFKNRFTTTATELFGSGWVWLVRDRGGLLSIETGSNAETPITGDGKPLLICDVWEHAYYIDYRNVRPDFLKAYWNIVNWEFASKNFDE
ncbi:MAG: superoxide dismutase [Prolixibacteraceae bacterium]|nr:superoxide dismutase [Burkholderiales bacterium]